MPLLLTALILLLGYIILILLYVRGWYSQKDNKQNRTKNNLPHISIIIPARNEESNIQECISSILNNRYPTHLREIIVIDDFSNDQTAVIAENLLKGNGGRVLRLEQYLSRDQRINSFKKKALEIAIGEARGTWIITTDADCKVPSDWLGELAGVMQKDSMQFIAAPVSFMPYGNHKSVLYYFQSLDFMTMQGITAASLAMNLGNMCNGANLAFRKTAFNAVGGYKGIDQIASGDDMLLMYKIRQQYPSGICYLKSPYAIVHTKVQPNWHDFINQRIRWSSKADKYDDKKLTWILAWVYFFNVTFIILCIAAIFYSFYWKWLAGIIFAKTIIELIFLLPVAKFYNKLNELIIFPLLQPLHILYIIAAGFLGKFGKYKWKGREVS